MRFFTIIPLMIIPLIIYNVIAWSGETFSSAAAIREHLDKDFMSVPMATGAQWDITPGAILIILSLGLLYFELMKAKTVSRSSVMNHALSMMVFIIALIEFLLFGAFATSIFFIIMLMCLMDVMAGFIIGIAVSKRDIGFEGGYSD